MKICIFSRPFHPAVGGLEQIAKTLAYEFHFSKNNVEVVTDTLIDISEKNEFPFKIIRTSSLKERYNAFKRADVILFMNFTFAGVPLAILAWRPIVLSHHIMYGIKGKLKTRIIEFSKNQFTRFFLNISVSNFLAKKIPGNSIVIPNAYDNKSFFYTQKKRDKDFVFCGRLVSDKGVNVLLESFKIILIEYPDSTLTIIGDGPYRKFLEEKSINLKLQKNIIYTGILKGKDLVNMLKEHSCMVIPSLWEEPFGIVALEGIASCDTLISSNRGGLPEAIGDCGILVNPTKNELAKAMISVLSAKKNNMPLPGQPSIEKRTNHLANYTSSKVAQRYIDVFKKAIK